jgi:hypothetical protein
MAWINTQHCRTCGHDTKHNGNTCLPCQERERKAAEDKWMAQTPDEKLLNLHRRLQAIERGPARY